MVSTIQYYCTLTLHFGCQHFIMVDKKKEVWYRLGIWFFFCFVCLLFTMDTSVFLSKVIIKHLAGQPDYNYGSDALTITTIQF